MIPTLLLLCAIPSAPVPLPKPRSMDVTPGKYVMYWGGTFYVVTLNADNTFEATIKGIRDRGTWYYVGKTLHVSETRDGKNWFYWNCTLDPGTMQGRARFGLGGVSLRMERVK